MFLLPARRLLLLTCASGNQFLEVWIEFERTTVDSDRLVRMFSEFQKKKPEMLFCGNLGLFLSSLPPFLEISERIREEGRKNGIAKQKAKKTTDLLLKPGSPGLFRAPGSVGGCAGLSSALFRALPPLGTMLIPVGGHVGARGGELCSQPT